MPWRNELPDPKTRVTISITDANDTKLDRWQRKIKRRGRIVTRSVIIHHLIEHADPDQTIAAILEEAK